jgi:hypothetical protein
LAAVAEVVAVPVLPESLVRQQRALEIVDSVAQRLARRRDFLLPARAFVQLALV